MLGDILAPLFRRLAARADRDGQAAALEGPALASDWADDDVDERGRRDRPLGLPQDILVRSLGQKVLHGWLQNRHQVLVPLTFRLGRLPAEDVGLLMRFAAASLLNATANREAGQRALERWLRLIGAEEAALAAFRQALGEPLALSTLVDEVRARRLESYAYAATVVAADLHEAAGLHFAGFVAARLALPADAVRSIDRRYRR